MSDLLTPEEALARLRAAVEKAGSVSAFARKCGVGHPRIWHILSGDERLSGRVAKALGIEAVTVRRTEFRVRT